LNSEMIGKIWKKDKLNSEMIWKIWKKIVKWLPTFLPYCPYLITIRLAFLPYSPNHFTIFFHIFHIISHFNISSSHRVGAT
jgi:hypothetical protein